MRSSRVLLLLPEPIISKLTAFVLAVGVGLLTIGIIVYAIVRSKSEILDAAQRQTEDEQGEDVLHQVNLQ